MIAKLNAKLMGAASLAAAAAVCATGAHAADVTRTYGTPTAIIAATASVPSTGYETVYLSGQLPTLPAAPAPPPGAEEQAENAFTKVADTLKSVGLTEGDVVHMTIYMWAPPGERMAFADMMKAYSRHYGTPTQPNRPTRSTIQVANLASPGAVLEVEVTAVRKLAPMAAKPAAKKK